MLKKLTVNNFALIENAIIQFDNGFTVITGETGSGKSILLGALKLILGERADYSVIRDESSKTVVEVVFDIKKSNLKSFFDDNDIDFWEETIIRREINSKGKSRAFINDTPVQLNLLKSITEHLIHIHSQHHTLELKNKSYQLNILDTIAENDDYLKGLKVKFDALRNKKKELESLKNKSSQIQMEAEFNQFQLEELQKLDLDQKDYNSIEQDVQRGEEFETIKKGYQLISSVINGDNGVITSLNALRKDIQVKDDRLNELRERIKTSLIELDDIAAIAENDLSDLDIDPNKLDALMIDFDKYNTALRKHRSSNQAELIALRDQLSSDVTESENINENITELEEHVDRLSIEAKEIAKEISKRRKNILPQLESDVKEYLTKLKINDASIKFELKESDLTGQGIDEVALYFSPNKGLTPQLIEKAASGGELSRLMLVLQYLLSQKKQLPTVIFDEIDTGVSGEVAQKIGDHLKKMGTHMQLLAITHLPQVASRGTNHIRVEKQTENGTTKTVLNVLDNNDRVEEIAKLMSGTEINQAAIDNAKNLMSE
jgi:DNA repair protein RecN (Recombination protein N)